MLKNIFFILLTFILLAAAVIFLPIDKVNWGRISILPAATITVTGTSQSDVANETAGFSATVSAVNADKQTAVNEVNTKMAALIKSIKDFGIADADIKTENVSVYQMPVSPVPVPQNGSAQTLIYPVPPVAGGSQGGDWQASNSITITLKDVSKASLLSDLLNQSGATNVYGPNLAVGKNTSATDASLLAKAGNQTVGKMINVQESGSNYPIPMLYATKDAGTSSPIQPGTSTLSKSVTVVFELK